MTFNFFNVLSHCFSQTFCFFSFTLVLLLSIGASASHWCQFFMFILLFPTLGLLFHVRALHQCWCLAWCQFFMFILLFPTLGLSFHVRATTSQCYYFVVMLHHALALLLHATAIVFSHCCCFTLFMLLFHVVVVSHLKQPMINTLLLLFCVVLLSLLFHTSSSLWPIPCYYCFTLVLLLFPQLV